ncbi:MFS transporter [Rhizocola hellebori]|uniref:MFS transporter n=1 Tax=Rhizocola hellebori TaxID=1392758 RepID=A0A8J3Q494_9ACTN|nr:MFS transporter [Rhizocola hellebori]GIH03212.1 MFS transporter [Rhizocola hellebori]
MLRERNSALFLGISLVAGFGGNAMSLVASIWVLSLTGSSSLAALIGFCLYLPSVFGPLVGTAVDRLPRQRLLVWTTLATAALMLTLLTLRSEGQLWILFTVMFGYGVCHVVLDAAEAALLPAALADAALGQLNGLRMSAREGMKLLAPAAGAGLFTWMGGNAVAVVVAATLAMTAWLYSLIRPAHAVPAAAGGRVLHDMRDGVRYLWSHRWLRVVVATAAVAVPMSGFALAASYSVIIDDLHQPPAFAGFLASAQGAGSIAGGLLAGRLIAWRGEAFLGGAGAVIFAASPLLRLIPVVPFAIVCSVLAGVGLLWTVVAAMTAVQRHTPQALLGRVAATAGSLTFAPTALAIPAGAAAVPVLGHHPPLVLTGIACLAVGVVALNLVRTEVPAVQSAA